jgi:serine/threonine-protein kinase HipA
VRQGDRWRRLHQEDFCQALGKPPSAKYEANQTGIKGPTLANMITLARNAMGAAEVVRLIDHVAFNVVACNTDAHAKNYSLMISGKGFTLAPIYDVMCATVFDGVTRNLAQKVGGKNRGEHLKRRHWQRFAQDCGLNGPRLIARLSALTAKVLAQSEAAEAEVAAMPGGGHVLLPDVRKAVEARANAIARGLSDTSGSDDA